MNKSAEAFRTISEVADLLETPAHVLRFWESRFPQIRPVKRAGGRRYYRPADVALLSGIRRLLHDDGLTIRGVQKILREQGVRHVSGLTEAEEAEADAIVMDEEADPVIPFPARLADATAEDEEDALAPGAADTGTEQDAVAEVVDAAFDDAEALSPAAAGIDAADPLPDTAGALLTEDDPTAPDRQRQGDEAPLHDAVGLGVAEEEPAEAPQTPAAESADLADSAPDPDPESPQAATEPPPRRVSVLDDPLAASPPEPEGELPEAAAAHATLIPFDPTEAAAEIAAAEAPAPEMAAPPPDAPTIPDLPPLTEPDPPQNVAWVAAELRGLRRGRLADRRPEVSALIARLQDLRERVADRGRIPRR